ncbi:MAG: ATP-binding protein [Caldilineaceae bacterium]
MKLCCQRLQQFSPALPKGSCLPATQPMLVELQSLSCRIAIVNEIAVEINRSLDLTTILQVVGQQVKWLLDFDHCSVCLYQAPDSREYVTLWGVAPAEEIWERLPQNPVEMALRTKQTQVLPHCHTVDETFPFRSQIVIPMESAGEMVGALNFAARQAELYTQEDVRIAYLLALQLGNAIRNTQRFEEISQLYQQLETAYTNLRDAEKVRDELVHMVVDDLRNPLMTINFSLSLIDQALRDLGQSTNKTSCITRAKKAYQQIVAMIDELLAIRKFEAGELHPILAPMDLGSLLLEKKESYQIQATVQKKTFSIQLPASLPTVMAGAELLGRVIDNLVSNAFKYTPVGGHIEVRVAVQHRELYVSVQDDGPGIPPAYHERIFDKFIQVTDANGAPIRKGTGLGLAFCRLAVRAHGGDIWVESNGKRGSTFIFSLGDC